MFQINVRSALFALTLPLQIAEAGSLSRLFVENKIIFIRLSRINLCVNLKTVAVIFNWTFCQPYFLTFFRQKQTKAHKTTLCMSSHH